MNDRELSRAARRRRIPVVGVPPIAKRERCANCNALRKPRTKDIERRVDRLGGGHHTEIIRRDFDGYEGYGNFHSLRCALAFAEKAYAAGYRK